MFDILHILFSFVIHFLAMKHMCLCEFGSLSRLVLPSFSLKPFTNAGKCMMYSIYKSAQVLKVVQCILTLNLAFVRLKEASRVTRPKQMHIK